jgi:hypothetical protein
MGGRGKKKETDYEEKREYQKTSKEKKNAT